jgi:hypothetical protein
MAAGVYRGVAHEGSDFDTACCSEGAISHDQALEGAPPLVGGHLVQDQHPTRRRSRLMLFW